MDKRAYRLGVVLVIGAAEAAGPRVFGTFETSTPAQQAVRVTLQSTGARE